MATENSEVLFQRGFGRRKEDKIIRDLLKVGQIITSEINMDVLFKIIIEQTSQIMNTERSTIFFYNDKSNELWPFHASGFRKYEAPVPPNAGISGWVFSNMECLVVNDVRNDSRFVPEIDDSAWGETRAILCVPLVNRQKQCIGAYQTVNKSDPDGAHVNFTNDDQELLSALSSFVVIAIENSKHYEELKTLDKAKERIINHLSHEMRTPLALVSVTFDRISKKIEERDVEGVEKALEMGKRNVNRLLQLQGKIDDIFNKKLFEEKLLITRIIEDALGFVEAFKEKHLDYEKIMGQVVSHIESFYNVHAIRFERIDLHDFLHHIVEASYRNVKGRILEIETSFEKGIFLNMDRIILEKTCTGLLKNSIENTPDEGRIEVSSKLSGEGIIIQIKDYGIGITKENQKMIFGGFYHTQDTYYYSSKEPYAFNAGGTGTDLLRIIFFSERCGFFINFKSLRCSVIPEDSDQCPGKVSNCKSIHGRSACLASGGSIFKIIFPSEFATK